MTWVYTYDYAIKKEFKTINHTNNPILIFPTQSIKWASLQSQHISVKRFFLSREEISRILSFNGQNRLLASIWLISQISRGVSKVSPTDSNKFSKWDLAPAFLIGKGPKKKKKLIQHAVHPCKSPTTDVTGSLDSSQPWGAKGYKMS